MWKNGKKNKIFSMLALCSACWSAGLYGAEVVVNKTLTDPQNWAASGTDADNSTHVVFKNENGTQGAINFLSASNDKSAANVTKETGVAEPRFLTIDFQNEPSVLAEINWYDENGEPVIESVGSAHIYSHPSSGDAVALHLADGVNVKFTGDTTENGLYSPSEDQKRAGIFAYVQGFDETAVGVELERSANLNFSIPTKIYARSNRLAVAIGKGSSGSDAVLEGNFQCQIDSNNEFTPSSLSSSSVVMGVVSFYNDASINMENATYCITGTNNTFSSCSSLSSSSAGAVIGAVSEGGKASVNTKNATYNISGTNNTFSAYSSSCPVVIGAVSGVGNASVKGDSIYNIGQNNTFTAANNCDDEKFPLIASAVIGAVSAGGDAIVSGRSVYEIKSGNMFSSLSSCLRMWDPNFDQMLISPVAAATVFGASASGGKLSMTMNGGVTFDGISTAHSTSMNICGSQTISAFAYAARKMVDSTEYEQENNPESYTLEHGLERVSVFGADDTDKQGDGAYGWRVGIYNEETEAATVNILGAKLAEEVVFTKKGEAAVKDAGTATVVLNADQGNSYQNYARAFALGKDFQIYIGGKSKIVRDPDTNEFYIPGEDESQFEIAGINTGNVTNIFGAIAPAQKAKLNDNGRCAGSKLTVDNNWTANVYGPIEGLEKLTVKNGGELNAFDRIQNVGSLRLKSGTLNLKTGGRKCLETALKSLTDGKNAPQLKFTHEIESGSENGKISNYAVESITLADDYASNKNRFARGGKLTIGAGEVLRFYIDTSTISESGLGEVSGMIKVDSELNDALDFQPGSKIEIVDNRKEPLPEDPAKIETIPAKFVLLQADDMTVPDFLGDDDLDNVERNENTGTWTLKNSVVNADFAEPDAEDNETVQTRSFVKNFIRALYSSVKDEPTLLAGGDQPVSLGFDQDGSNVRMFFNGTVNRTIPTSSIPPLTAEKPSLPEIGSSSARITTVVTSIFRSAINPRLTKVGSHGDGAFIYGAGGHVHQSSIAGIGHGGNLYGVVAGIDKLLNYKSGCIRLGAIIGYIYGDIDFHGSAIGKKQTSKQNNYLGALYGDYESFNEKNLKTNFNLSCGFGYTKHRLNRVDQQGIGYNAKMKSNNFFISAEFIKNLYAMRGIQFGPWMKADYNHIHQKAYSENGGSGTQSISKAKFDFLDTTVGVNIEKEIQNSEHSNSNLKLYMKAGWNCQPMRSHSTIAVRANAQTMSVSPHFGSRNSAVFTVGLRQKLNTRWDVTGEWNGSFSKKYSHNMVTFCVGYTF